MPKKTSARLLMAYFMAELVGTFLLVIIGDGVIATYVLTRRMVDPMSACLAFGVGAMLACFASAKLSGAHINPAASVAFAVVGKLRWSLVPVYLAGQYMGGFLAALVLYLNNYEALNSLDGGARETIGTNNASGAIFATYPATWTSLGGAFLDQLVGTAVLLFAISAITDKLNACLEDRHQPISVALTIGFTCLAFNPNCGAIFNPARDLAPRLLTALVGYPGVWAPISSLYWLVAGVLGPHAGALLGVLAYRLTIGQALEWKRLAEPDGRQQSRIGTQLQHPVSAPSPLNEPDEPLGAAKYYGSQR